MLKLHYSFIGKARFRRATLSCDSSYSFHCLDISKNYCTIIVQASTSNQDSQDLPDSTESEEKNNQNAKANSEEMDFDIDDIDKELEMALERKRVGNSWADWNFIEIIWAGISEEMV